MKPHIALVRGYWEVYRSRADRRLISLSSSFSRLAKIGPWRPAEIAVWYGDAKKPV